MENDWGEYHWVKLYARISSDITLKDVDQRVKELVLSQVEDSKTETEKAQRIITLQIVAEGCTPEEYEYTIANGSLGDLYLTEQVFDSYGKERHVHTDFNRAKFFLKFGHLITSDNEYYRIISEKTEHTVGTGFYLMVDNNKYASISKEKCEQMIEKIKDLIIRKYSALVSIVKIRSY